MLRELHLALHSLEPVRKLLEKVLDDPLIVVTPTQNVVQGREAMSLTGFLLMVELFRVKLVIPDQTPVVAGGVHGEARRESPVDTNDHGILAGAAVPGKMVAFHKVNHLPEPRIGVDHFIARILLLGQPLNCLFDQRPIISPDVGHIIRRVLEVLVLLEQGRLIDVVVGGDTAVMRDLGKLPHVVQVVAADIDV